MANPKNSRANDNATPAQADAPLNAGELTSIRALLAFAAQNQNVKEDTVRAITARHFGVEAVEQIDSRSYDEAVRFLVDTQIKLLIN